MKRIKRLAEKFRTYGEKAVRGHSSEEASLPDYSRYVFSKKQWMLVLAKSGFLVALLAFLFYRSWWAVPVLSPLTGVVIRRRKEKLKRERLEELNRQFRQGLQCVSSSLRAGWSVENAFREGLKDLYYIYGTNALIVKEFEYIARGVELNEPLESLLISFGERSGLEDARIFAQVFSMAKRTRGDVAQIMAQTAGRIGDKIQVQQEIHTYLHGKQLEQKIMNGMPCGILLYVGVCSPDFLAPLYGNITGAAVMTACLAVYGAAVLLAEKIGDIQV